MFAGKCLLKLQVILLLFRHSDDSQLSIINMFIFSKTGKDYAYIDGIFKGIYNVNAFILFWQFKIASSYKKFNAIEGLRWTFCRLLVTFASSVAVLLNER